MIIRHEQPEDNEAIFAVETAAFEQQDEALIVNKLREADAIVCSLVAVSNATIVGHALYSIGHVKSDMGIETAVALGPIAVHPDYQKQGIGGKLILQGNQYCHDMGYDFVAVLGHPTYYPRFGFQPSFTTNIHCEFDVRPEVFMLLELKKGALAHKQGTFHYHTAFH